VIARAAALLAVVAVAAPVAAAEPAEVGFVNLAAGSGGQTAIASMRGSLSKRSDWKATAPIPALERPRSGRGDRPPRLDLGEAREAYRAFQNERALELLERLEEARRDLPPSPALFNQLAAIALLRGQVLGGADRESDAIAAFARAHALSSDETLAPARYPPAVRQLYARAVAATRRSKGELAIAAPAGATIWVDAARVGDAPLKPVPVSAGGHLVTAVLAGHRIQRRWVEAGEVAIELEPLPELERAAALRETLSPRALDAGVLEQIARAAGVDVLVIVASRDGAIAAALYDARGGSLGDWTSAGPQIFGDAPPGAAISGGGETAERPWYKTWWGVSLIGGGVVVAAVLIVAATNDNVGISLGF
jgi:hypothetical protein